MPKMDEVLVKHFDDTEELFFHISDNLITRSHKLGFRGHASSFWELKTTLTRFSEKIHANFPRNFKDLESLTKIARYRLSQQFINNLIINNDLPRSQVESMDIWQYGQHFGLPSPLLDWSYSPYIALFFALSGDQNADPKSEKCIWVINLDLINELNDFIEREIRPEFKDRIMPEESLHEQFPILRIVGDIEHHNRRLAFQQGFFSDHGFYHSLEIWLKRIVSALARPNTDKPVLQKLSFNCSEIQKMEILDRLDKMNINNRTLFPDIEGSVKDSIDATNRSFQSPNFQEFSYWHESIEK